MELGIILGFGALSVLALAGSAFVVWRSVPAEFRRRLDAAEKHVEAMFAEWAAAKLHFEKLREELTDLADTVESKRKRVAARQSRQDAAAAAAPPDPGTPEFYDALRARAREMGAPV